MKDTIIQTVKLLCSALRNLSLYPASHPAISQPVEKCYQSILVLFKEREPLVMGIIDDVLLFDEIPFYETDTIWKELHRRMTVHKIESVTFAGELEQRELKAFINCLDLPAEESEQEGGFAALLEAQEVSHIRIKEIEEDLRERAREVYDHSLTLVYDIMSELRMGRIPSGEGAKAVMSDMQDIILKDKSALLALTMLKGYDNYTYVHSVNVGVLCLAFGAHEKLEPEAMRSLGIAGMLHDVGKVRTAEDIIKKPGSLTEAEITIMKKHPVLGAEIISRMEGISQETHEMVLLHHVKHNLKGYPKIESGREVHPYSMAVALADCYDALTTLRPYQKPRPPSDAVKVMRKLAGKDLDPVMLERFVDMLGTYPAGTFVRLTSNEIAIIRKPNELNVTLPKVRIVTDGNGAQLGAPEEVDLAENSTAPGSEPRAVVAGVNPIVYGLDPAKYL